MNAVPALLAAALAFAPIAVAAEENAPGAAGAPPTVAVGRRGERRGQARRRDGQPVDRGREADRRRGVQRERAPRRGGDRRAESGRSRRQGHRHRRPVALSGVEQHRASRAASPPIRRSTASRCGCSRSKGGALIAQAVAERRRIPGRRLRCLRPRSARGRAARQGGRERRASRRTLCARRGDEARAAAIDQRRRGAADVPAAHGDRPRVKAAGAPTPPPIEPGLITLTETVSATWALAPQ